MKILDRYIAKNFLYGYCIVLFVMIGMMLLATQIAYAGAILILCTTAFAMHRIRKKAPLRKQQAAWKRLFQKNYQFLLLEQSS